MDVVGWRQCCLVKSLRRMEEPYTIEIGFRNIKNTKDKKACNNLPTSFALNKNELGLIDRVVPKLIADDPHMKLLRASVDRDLNPDPPI